MKDSTQLEMATADASGVEALFDGLRPYLLKEAKKTLPVLTQQDGATGPFRENSLERLWFAEPGNSSIPHGSVVLIPSANGE